MGEVMVEGTYKGSLVRAYWDNGTADMHPIVQDAADRMIALGKTPSAAPGMDPVPKDFYKTPEGFVALMRGTLDTVTKVTGYEPRPTPPGVID